LARSRDWESLAFRVLAEPGREARDLFGFVGAWAPPVADVATGWGAWDAETLVGALLLERAGGAAMLHGPVITGPATTDYSFTLPGPGTYYFHCDVHPTMSGQVVVK